MLTQCHRCHRDLPGRGAAYAASGDDDQALFCPACGAPQLRLPEYLWTEIAAVPAAATTGAVPPPVPQLIEWSVVLGCALPVAVVTAVLALAALRVPGLSFLNTLCVLGGAGVVLGLYRARRPLARINGLVGLRIGLLTGLLMVATMGVGMAVTGVVERFATHGMTGFDQQVDEQFSQLRSQMTAKMQEQEQGREAQEKVIASLASPEVRAGIGLFYLAILALLVTALTTACGGFAGMLQTRRRPLPRGE